MKLTLSLAQIQVIRGEPEQNIEKAAPLIKEAAQRGSDLIVFPEMWTTGFDWNRNLQIAKDQNLVIARIAALAKQHNIWINGSVLMLDETGKPCNASILFDSHGNIAALYKKTHLFSLLHEEKHFTPGDTLVAAETPWGVTGLSICYDLRFPELFRTYALQGAKIATLPAAFPYPRLDHWKTLLRARAIENQMYIIAVNQVSQEDFGKLGTMTYFGSSTVIDPWGKVIVEACETEEMLITTTINMGEVDKVRSKMTVLKDRRPELYFKERSERYVSDTVHLR